MVRLTVALLLVALAVCSANHPRGFQKLFSQEQNPATIWAVLVAGSNGWDNYRHQADICHAYHTLREHGVPAANIITMMYDDIARNKQNPYPGKLFNEPNGPDVYYGCVLDYTGTSVTPANFLAVLSGDKASVKGGNGRVVGSTSSDNIFVFFADHGSAGLVAFPNDILTASKLNTALVIMNTKKKFAKLTFYLEACESGSMFSGILKNNINVYAITAASETESSWGCYCNAGMNLPCLGDLFSVMWMADSDKHADLATETLQQQWATVKQQVTASEVKHYGDLTIANNYVAAFQGWTKKNSQPLPKIQNPSSVWPARDVKLLSLKTEVEKSVNMKIKQKAQMKLRLFEMKRQYLDNFMEDFVNGLVHEQIEQQQAMSVHLRITQLECHDTVVNAFHKTCFHFSQNPYALKYGFVLANLCEMGIPSERIVAEMEHKCSYISYSDIH